MATQAIVNVLTTNEQAGNGGFTHLVTFGPGGQNKLTESTADTDMTFNLWKSKPGDVMVKAALVLNPAFNGTATGFPTSTAFNFGDEDDADRHVDGVETNVNGTEVLYTFGNTAYLYTAVKQLTVLIESNTAEKLSLIDVGTAALLVQILSLQTIPKSVTG